MLIAVSKDVALTVFAPVMAIVIIVVAAFKNPTALTNAYGFVFHHKCCSLAKYAQIFRCNSNV